MRKKRRKKIILICTSLYKYKKILVVQKAVIVQLIEVGAVGLIHANVLHLVTEHRQIGTVNARTLFLSLVVYNVE